MSALPAASARAAPRARRWRTLQVFLHGAEEDADRLLVEVIGPVAERALASPPGAWSFARRAVAGPHVSLRLRGPIAAVAEVEGAVRAWVAGRGWVTDHRLARPPELGPDERGGAAGEDLSGIASRLSIAVLRECPDRDDRQDVAAELLVALFAATDAPSLRRAAWLRWFASSLAAATDGPGLEVCRLRVAAERAYFGRGAAEWDRLTRLDRLLRHGRGGDSPPALWYRAVGTAVQRLRRQVAAGRLEMSIDRVLMAQVHLLLNRLGLTIPEECSLAWLISLAFADPARNRDRIAPEPGKYVRPLREIRPTIVSSDV